MEYLAPFRNPARIQHLSQQIRGLITRPWNIMEVCGGQTHGLIKYGIPQLLPPEVQYLHGPGCPVCVTPLGALDRVMKIAAEDQVILCTFGDMLRVPGSETDLRSLKALGSDIRILYSPLDSVKVAQENPDQKIVFFAIGFETTAPANAMAIYQAQKLGLKNYFALVSHMLAPPAMAAILQAVDSKVQGFLAPGHVCSIMGLSAYRDLAAQYQIPIVVTGFEPYDLLEGTYLLLRLLEAGECRVINQYQRSVRETGNPSAQMLMDQVFEVCDQHWRGIGMIPHSGLKLRGEFAELDARRHFPIPLHSAAEPSACKSGEVLKGLLKPDQCPAFATSCHPRTPLGATMVSSEGACAAYYHYLQQSKC